MINEQSDANLPTQEAYCNEILYLCDKSVGVRHNHVESGQLIVIQAHVNMT